LSSTPDLPLSGCGIAITRPRDQAQALTESIAEAGGNAILFPLLEIVPLEDYTAFDAVTADLGCFDWAVFISTNAVEYSLNRLCARQAWPAALRCAGIGPSTRAELARFGIRDVLIPQDRFDSESLLNLPEMREVEGKRFVVFRGEQGRELLADTLRQRGAEVAMAESYRRINPQQDSGELKRLWQQGRLHAIVVTSSEALRNLLALVGTEHDWLSRTPLFVNHPRIAETATSHGLKAIVAARPGYAGMLATLVEHKQEMLSR
jgi:uroporphyrinogen-III synthase